MKIAISVLLCAIPISFACGDPDDFVSGWTASNDSPTQYVLRVPKKDQQSSFWNPSNGPIPISPERAIELAFNSDSIRKDKRIWKVIQVRLWATSPLLYSTIPTPPVPSEGSLITYYSITVSHQKTGASMEFMVLMDGRVFEPHLEKKAKAEQGAAANP
jgi:hypothetical protein